MSSSAASVNELWVAESDVTEQGGCDAVIDVDAPPIIRISPTAPPQPTTDNTIKITPTLGNVLAVEPFIEIFLEDKTVEGPEWETNICPPSRIGTFTYTLDAYSLSGNLVQRFVSVNVN